MNEVEFEKLIETSWRRELQPEEESRLESWLAAHPKDAARWRTDAGLSRLFRRHSDVPVTSNFTERVLAALDQDQRTASRRPTTVGRWVAGWRRRWRPVGLATAGVLLAGLFAWMQHATLARQTAARELAELPVLGLPSGELFQDFDAIRELRTLPAVSDDDLLAALQ